jgi:hypothetical protein
MMNIIYILVSQPPPLYLLSPFGHCIQNSIIHIWIIYIHCEFDVKNDLPNQIRQFNKLDTDDKEKIHFVILNMKSNKFS